MSVRRRKKLHKMNAEENPLSFFWQFQLQRGQESPSAQVASNTEMSLSPNQSSDTNEK